MAVGLIQLVSLLSLLAVALVWMGLCYRREWKLSNFIRRRLDEGEIRPLDEPALAKSCVGKAVGQLLEVVGQSVDDAERRVKELEIQLKVVAGERQDSQAILHSISDAVLVTDPFDELVLANESAARVFKFDAERAQGQPLDKVLKDPKLVDLIREMRKSGSTNGRRVVEHTVHEEGEATGTERTYKITMSSVSGEIDRPAGVVAVLHDMTREKEVAQMKNEFVSNVSHELRTPLASIRAYVEMLLDGEADDEKTTREFHEVIQSEANRLSRLIDNILSISRIESGLVPVKKQLVSLTVIMKEAIEVITPQAKTKKITLVEKLSPVFYQTHADKDMIYQAALNLLSNAVKYTPENGKIEIETLINESEGKVISKVRDNGAGIPPKDLPQLFDKFHRCEANNHMAKGTGLGLALVKHIVETVHKGRLSVESEVGKGSCFSIELELAK